MQGIKQKPISVPVRPEKTFLETVRFRSFASFISLNLRFKIFKISMQIFALKSKPEFFLT